MMLEGWSFAFPWVFLLLPLPYAVYRFAPGQRAESGALKIPSTVAGRFEAEGRTGLAARAHRFLPIVLWVTLLTALAGPQRVETVAALPASGRDLMLAFDLSGSMEVEDFELGGETVSRLEAVKEVSKAFVKARGGDRVGLVIFAEEAYVAAPLTFDVAAVARTIEEVQIGISGRTTAIGGGLGLALKRLKDSTATSRVIILLSDGTNTSGDTDPEAVGRLAAETGVRVHTIALGERSLEDDPTLRDAVDTRTLRQIAAASGGTAFRVRDTADLQEVAASIDALEPSPFDRPAASAMRDYWVYPASLAFGLCLVLIAARRQA